MQRRLNLHYATIHGTYWMVFGVLYSFSSVYLLGKGYSNSEIGLILALGNLIAVLVQPFLADLADQKSKSTIFTMMGAMNVGIIILSVLMSTMNQRSMTLSILYVITLAMLMATQPFANAVNRRLSETGAKISFGACRAMGSFAYSVMCLVLGAAVERNGISTLSITGEIMAALSIIAIVATYRSYKSAMQRTESKGNTTGKPTVQDAQEVQEVQEVQEDSAKQRITLTEFAAGHKLFMVLSLGVLGLYFSNSAINMYMAQIADSVGGNSEDVGRVFSLLAFMEIPTLVLFDKLHQRFKLSSMLKFSAVAFALWIGTCAMAKNVGMLLGAQIFQPFAFALFLPSMVRYIDTNMREGEAIKGQMLFTVVTTTAAIFAGLVGGRILDIAGARTMMITATTITVIGCVIVMLILNKLERSSAYE